MPGCKLNVETAYTPVTLIDDRPYGGFTQHVITLDTDNNEELVVKCEGYKIFINRNALCSIEKDDNV